MFPLPLEPFAVCTPVANNENGAAPYVHPLSLISLPFVLILTDPPAVMSPFLIHAAFGYFVCHFLSTSPLRSAKYASPYVCGRAVSVANGHNVLLTAYLWFCRSPYPWKFSISISICCASCSFIFELNLYESNLTA